MKKGIDLTRIWSATNGISTTDDFVYLRVQTEDMPGSLLTDDLWFVTNNRLPEGGWFVMLRLNALREEGGLHAEAARAIVRSAEIVAPANPNNPPAWISIRPKNVNVGPVPSESSKAKPLEP